MKKQFTPFLVLAALGLAACGQKPADSPNQSSESTSEESTSSESLTSSQGGSSFAELVTAIKEGHNYTIDISTKLDIDEKAEESQFFNIDDKALFSSYYEGYTGFVAQEDQGYVNFLLAGDSVLPQYFYSTNAEAGISELYDVCAENLFLADYVEDQENPGHYVSDDTDVIAVACNFTGYIGAFGFIAPENVEGYEEDGNLVIEVPFELYYQDEYTGQPMHPFGLTTLTIHDIGSTSNEVVEDYIANPTYSFLAPTEWSTSDVAYFNQYFARYTPSLPEGTSYAYSLEGPDPTHPMDTYALFTDYGCGNLLESYGQTLVNDDGFTKVSEKKYTKTVVDEQASKTTKFTVEMVYVSPETEQGMHTVGFYYPEGIFQVKYSSKTVNNAVVTASAFNSYIMNNDLDDVVPMMNFEGCTSISGFIDNTDAWGQEYAGDYLFVTKGDGGQYFNVNFDSVASAKAASDGYVAALKEKGFSEEQPFFGSLNLVNPNDPNGSYVTITPSSAISGPKFQLRFQIYSSVRQQKAILSSISISGMKTTFYVGDTFVFNGSVIARYNDDSSKLVEPTSVSRPDMSTPGTKTITVSYTEGEVTKTASYSIDVVSRSATKPTIEFQANMNVTSYSITDLNGNPITEYDDSIDDGYFCVNATCEDTYYLSGVSIAGDDAADCSYSSNRGCWMVSPSKKDVTTITVVPTLTAKTTFVGGDPNNEHVAVKMLDPYFPSNFTPGEYVTFSLIVEDGYSVQSMYIKEDPSIEITKSFFGASYRFEMPNSSATIVVVVSEESPEPEQSSFSSSSSETKGDPLITHGAFEFTCTEDENRTMEITFHEDGTGETTARQRLFNGDMCTISHTFKYRKGDNSGNTVDLSIWSFTQTGKTGSMNVGVNLTKGITYQAIYSADGKSISSIVITLNSSGAEYHFVYNA